MVPSTQRRPLAREYPMYLVRIPAGMFMQDVLQYWTIVKNITHGSFPDPPRILRHVSAMYCEIVHRMKPEFRYCQDPYILWIRRVYASTIIKICSIFGMVHEISLHTRKVVSCILIYLTHCRVMRVFCLPPNHQQCQREYG
jgi:hypothetical protein